MILTLLFIITTTYVMARLDAWRGEKRHLRPFKLPKLAFNMTSGFILCWVLTQGTLSVFGCILFSFLHHIGMAPGTGFIGTYGRREPHLEKEAWWQISSNINFVPIDRGILCGILWLPLMWGQSLVDNIFYHFDKIFSTPPHFQPNLTIDYSIVYFFAMSLPLVWKLALWLPRKFPEIASKITGDDIYWHNVEYLRGAFYFLSVIILTIIL